MTAATTIDVPMPRLSDGMEEGTILSWLVGEGEPVRAGDPLVEIETDKASMVHEAEGGGVLQVVAEAGATVAVGEVIARLVPGSGAGEEAGAAGGPEGAPVSQEGAAAGRSPADEPEGGEGGDTGAGDAPSGDLPAGHPPPPVRSAPAASPAESAAPAAPGANGGAPRATPVARRLAAAHGIELAAVEGTGPGGRIRSRDVRAAAGLEAPAPAGAAAPAPAAAPPAASSAAAAAPASAAAPEPAASPAAAAAPASAAAPEPTASPAAAATSPAAQTAAKGAVEVVELSRTRATIARRMAQAKATIPEFVVEREAALDALLAFRATLKAQIPDGTAPPSLNDFVVAAAARALAADRTLNASWRDGRVERYGRVNVGVAVAAPGGLVVPVVHDADALSLGAIARRTRALAAAAREGRLSPPDLAGGTFTVSNLGMMGVTRLVPIINDPQAAILGAGRAVPRVVLEDGVPVQRTEMALTLAGDHRVADGADGAAFLARVCELLEAPALLALG